MGHKAFPLLRETSGVRKGSRAWSGALSESKNVGPFDPCRLERQGPRKRHTDLHTLSCARGLQRSRRARIEAPDLSHIPPGMRRHGDGIGFSTAHSYHAP